MSIGTHVHGAAGRVDGFAQRLTVHVAVAKGTQPAFLSIVCPDPNSGLPVIVGSVSTSCGGTASEAITSETAGPVAAVSIDCGGIPFTASFEVMCGATDRPRKRRQLTLKSHNEATITHNLPFTPKPMFSVKSSIGRDASMWHAMTDGEIVLFQLNKNSPGGYCTAETCVGDGYIHSIEGQSVSLTTTVLAGVDTDKTLVHVVCPDPTMTIDAVSQTFAQRRRGQCRLKLLARSLC